MGMKPRSPAHFRVSEAGDRPATPMGGCGAWRGKRCGAKISCTGSGRSTFQYLPSCLNGLDRSQRPRMISSDSRVMARMSPGPTPNMAWSVGMELAATPKFRRPSDRWSSITSRLARAAG